jgi:hypothetical protein
MRNTIKCAIWTSEKFTPEMMFLFPEINPGRAPSGQQTSLELMKNKPNKITDVCDLPAEAERTVFDGHIHETLKQVEGNVAAQEIARPADARFARREDSGLQPASRLGHACFRCPHRLDSCRSVCCG